MCAQLCVRACVRASARACRRAGVQACGRACGRGQGGAHLPGELRGHLLVLCDGALGGGVELVVGHLEEVGLGLAQLEQHLLLQPVLLLHVLPLQVAHVRRVLLGAVLEQPLLLLQLRLECLLVLDEGAHLQGGRSALTSAPSCSSLGHGCRGSCCYWGRQGRAFSSCSSSSPIRLFSPSIFCWSASFCDSSRCSASRSDCSFSSSSLSTRSSRATISSVFFASSPLRYWKMSFWSSCCFARPAWSALRSSPLALRSYSARVCLSSRISVCRNSRSVALPGPVMSPFLASMVPT